MSEAYTLERIFEEFSNGICVPRIQRGYVQGRGDEKGIEIQANFAPALVDAVFGGNELSLDFIYGVATEGQLLPLDGQQRLTTLFLLAWLCRKWKSEWRFTYESRRIPQLFVEGLLEFPCNAKEMPSTEIEESGWFLPIWKKDPSVAGMLQMLDVLHLAIGQRERDKADFKRISFLLHGIDGHSDTFDHIFRKMNSRGKELSPWENMKAMLDKYLPRELAGYWRDKVDGDWAKCIWNHAGEEIAVLDNAMEKTIRMAYALFVSDEAQKDSLWKIEKKLMGGGDDAFNESTRNKFYETAKAFFDAMPFVAKYWTNERTRNALWCETIDKQEYWKWVSNGQDAPPSDGLLQTDETKFWDWISNNKPATLSDLLRMTLLSEKVHEGVQDASRRRRILLNLLDASSINKDNFAKALDAGLAFLAGKIDLEAVAGYSATQLRDEQWKYNFNGDDIALQECHPLVWQGSLAFLGQMSSLDMSDSLQKLLNATNNDAKKLFLDILGLSGKCDNGLPCQTIKIPRASATWAEECFSLNRLFLREGIAAWLKDEHYSTNNGSSAWLNHLAGLWNTIANYSKIAQKDAGWLFCVEKSNLSSNSIRLVLSRKEYENIQKLADVQITGNGIYYLSWKVLPYDGIMKAKSGDWYWNVRQASWWTSDSPPQGKRDADGNIQFIAPSTDG